MLDLCKKSLLHCPVVQGGCLQSRNEKVSQVCPCFQWQRFCCWTNSAIQASAETPDPQFSLCCWMTDLEDTFRMTVIITGSYSKMLSTSLPIPAQLWQDEQNINTKLHLTEPCQVNQTVQALDVLYEVVVQIKPVQGREFPQVVNHQDVCEQTTSHIQHLNPIHIHTLIFLLISSLLYSRRSFRISLKWTPSALTMPAWSRGNCSITAFFRISSSIKMGLNLPWRLLILLRVGLEARLTSLYALLKEESGSYFVNLKLGLFT